MEALRLVWDEAFTAYDFGVEHPMAPIRLELTARLADALGLLDAAGVHVVSAEPASDELLLTVHAADYVEAVRRASTRPTLGDLKYGLGSSDVPTFPGMHEASARICAASGRSRSRSGRGRPSTG